MPNTPEARPTTSKATLTEQIVEVKQSIRAAPNEVKHRVHFTQLLMLTGQWERALEQLQTAAQLDAKTIPMAQTYRELIQAEVLREQVFSGIKQPLSKDSYQPVVTLLTDAIKHRQNGKHTRADELQDQAYSQVDASPICIDGTTAQWLADADSRLGPSCELFINGGYYWVGFNHIRTLELEPPQDLRDLVWIPAKVTLLNDTEKLAFLPARYPFSYRFDDQIALAARTEWQALSETAWAGIGQKMLVSEQRDFALLEARSLTPDSSSDVAV
ncbi:type VI secretion system accessory protein TagJ [Gilvimarinus japonicus]|uniref:Type VI secretion system accessory protein TagJ n=1 Tax=Gilvimarinus japonicus TaxID=1796469 RepID=A0ABV7HQU2_9GAMM